MTIKTIRTNEAEANMIVDDQIRFVFRSDKDFFKQNDIIEFRVIKAKRDVLHRINSCKFVVTAVMDNMTAPIEKGYQFIAFRRI